MLFSSGGICAAIGQYGLTSLSHSPMSTRTDDRCGRQQVNSVLLSDGRVLVVGGIETFLMAAPRRFSIRKILYLATSFGCDPRHNQCVRTDIPKPLTGSAGRKDILRLC